MEFTSKARRPFEFADTVHIVAITCQLLSKFSIWALNFATYSTWTEL